MPLTSADIAATIGAQQQMSMGNMAYGGMISAMSGLHQHTPMAAEAMAGGMLNRGMAVAPIAAGLGAGMLGLDPFSMGISALMGDKSTLLGSMSGRFGLAGRAAMGVGAGLGVGAIGMAAQYGMQQMNIGMQQQQQLNSTLRSSFNFITPAGQGFSNSQMGIIGQGMRGMAGEMGPGGQMTSFSELTSLAAGMGQMGGQSALRSAHEFQQKFRQHVQTLKQISDVMGTTMQEAQQFTQQMKGSGLFTSGDQARAAGTMRQYSASGTLAMSEIGAMGNIGMQISRSVGGRGRAGTFAGMRTMGMIGGAIDSGTLTEEDIFNATGLTGAEGRQAYATSQLSSAAGFLRNGKGRWLLASMAGKDGHLDANSVSEWMGGAVSVGRTQQMAHKNLAGVGRANFIRNEGRLRGEALAQFGGLLPAMALTSWADQRGIDVDNMNDREMLFASRHLGIGMDQMEGTIKQVRDMPNTMRKMRMTEDADGYLRQMARQKSTTGIEGAKKALDHAREKVQGSLQQMGANLYQDLTNDIEGFINKMSGIYVEQANTTIQGAYEAAKKGKGGQLRDLIGTSSKRAGYSGRLASGSHSREDNMFDSIAGALHFNTTDASRMKAAGYGGLSAGDAHRLSRAANNSSKFGGISLGAEAQGFLTDQYSLGNMSALQGKDRADALLKSLQGGGGEMAQLADKMQGMSAEDRMSFVAALEKKAGIAAGAGIGGSSGVPELNMLTGGARTLGDLHRSVGEGIVGGDSNTAQKTLHQLTKGASFAGIGGAMAALGPLSALAAPAAALGYGAASLGARGIDKAISMYRGTAGRAQAAGEYLTSDAGQSLLADMSSSDVTRQSAANKQINQQLQTLKSQKAKGVSGLDGNITMFTNLRGAMEVMQMSEKLGRPLNDEEYAHLARKVGTTPEMLKSAEGSVSQAQSVQAGANVRALGRMYGGTARARLAGMEGGMLSDDVLAAVEKAGGAGARSALQNQASALRFEAGLGLGGDVQTEAMGIDTAASLHEASDKSLRGMSVKQLKASAQAIREKGGPSFMALSMEERAHDVQRATNKLRGRGRVTGLLEGIGVGVTDEQRKTLSRLSGSARSEAEVQYALRGLGGTEMSLDEARSQLEQVQAENASGSGGKDADKKLADAQKQMKLAEASADVRARIKGIGTMKGEAAGSALADLQNSDSLRVLQENQKEKEDKNNPMVKAIESLKESLDPLKKIDSGIASLPAGIASQLSGMLPFGSGGDKKPKEGLGEAHGYIYIKRSGVRSV